MTGHVSFAYGSKVVGCVSKSSDIDDEDYELVANVRPVDEFTYLITLVGTSKKATGVVRYTAEELAKRLKMITSDTASSVAWAERKAKVMLKRAILIRNSGSMSGFSIRESEI